jgi:hypothetical protein
MGMQHEVTDEPEHYSECNRRDCMCNDQCPKCGQMFVNGETAEDEEGVCADCYDYIMASD